MIPTDNPPLNPGPTSLGSKLSNIFVSPSFVFEEVAQAPHRFANWLVPLSLVCVASLLLLVFTTDKDRIGDTLHRLVQNETITQAQSSTISSSWSTVSVGAVCLSAVAGTLWSSFVLWLVGRLFLGTRIRFGKALEIVGLTSVIMVLGAAVTIALVAALGDPAARPALSLFAGRLPSESPLFALLQALNVFHVWSAVVLAFGLSRVGRIPYRQGVFWVFGYWLVLRSALTLLA